MVVAELPRVAATGYEFYREGGMPGGFVASVFVDNWTGILSENRGVFLGLWGGDRFDVFEGGIGAVICPDLNNGQLTAVECFWYVKPGNRGDGLRLLRAYEQWARTAGAVRIVMVHLCSLAPDSLGRLYERRGYKKVEVNYIKNL